MSILTAPVLSQAIDTEGGGTVELTVTPGNTGDQRVLYRIRGAASWTDGGTFSGTAGTGTTHDVTGLTNDEVYEFVVLSEQGFNTSHPSVAHRATPTDGSGSVEERAIAAIVLALQGITIANGYAFDVGRVYRHEQSAGKGRLEPVVMFVDEEPDASRPDGAMGGNHVVRNTKAITISARSERQGRTDGATSAEASKEAKRLYDAIGKAIGGDLILDDAGNRKVLYIRYLGHRSGIGTEGDPGVIAHVRFEVHYRHRSDNPSVKV